MKQFFEYAGKAFEQFGILDALEIVLLAVAIYYISIYIKKVSAQWYNKFLFVFVLCGVLFGILGLNSSHIILVNLFMLVLLGTIVIFAQDIKRGVWKLSRPRQKAHKTAATAEVKKDVTDEDLRRATTEIVRAVQNLAKKNTGALMIFSRTSLPEQIVESGTRIEARISTQIIETLFFKNTPLHDGAALFMENTLIAAGCFLPLSMEVNIPKELGTRHRAAIGVTEVLADAVAIVVSEETGIISLAYQGKIYRYLDTEQLTTSVEAAIGLIALTELPFLKSDKEEEKNAEKE